MKATEFKKGQSVVVTTKNGKVEGTISGVDMNVCTFMGHRTKRFFQWSGKMGERF